MNLFEISVKKLTMLIKRQPLARFRTRVLFLIIESSPRFEFITALMQLTHSSCIHASINAIFSPLLNLFKTWKRISSPPRERNSVIHSAELVWIFALSPEKFWRHEELRRRMQSSAETSDEMVRFSTCFPSATLLNFCRTTLHLFATLTVAITKGN